MHRTRHGFTDSDFDSTSTAPVKARKYDIQDVLIVKSDAPIECHPNTTIVARDAELISSLDYQPPSWLYNVEYREGEFLLIPEHFLEAYPEINKFTWDDQARIRDEAPEYLHPGEIVAVCGVTQMISFELARTMRMQIGQWFYTVEFGDGSSIQIPEMYLEPYVPHEGS